MTVDKNQNFERYTKIYLKAWTNSHDIKDENLMKFFRGIKIKIWDISRDKKFMNHQLPPQDFFFFFSLNESDMN